MHYPVVWLEVITRVMVVVMVANLESCPQTTGCSMGCHDGNLAVDHSVDYAEDGSVIVPDDARVSCDDRPYSVRGFRVPDCMSDYDHPADPSQDRFCQEWAQKFVKTGTAVARCVLQMCGMAEKCNYTIDGPYCTCGLESSGCDPSLGEFCVKLTSDSVPRCVRECE